MGDGPPEQREMSEPPGRQRHHDDKGHAIGKAKDRAETAGRSDAADGGAERSPSERCQHQRRRGAGGQGNENDRDHQLSRSFRAVRGFSKTPTIGNRTTRKPYEEFRSAVSSPQIDFFYR